MELVALRETIVRVEAVLATPPAGSSLPTVVKAARVLRVSRSRDVRVTCGPGTGGRLDRALPLRSPTIA